MYVLLETKKTILDLQKVWKILVNRKWSRIGRGFVAFLKTLLLPIITVTFSRLRDKFHGQINLQIFFKKFKKKPIVFGYCIKRYKRFFYVTNSGLLLGLVTLQCLFVSFITFDYNINSKKWNLDKLLECFNFKLSDFSWHCLI